MTNKNTPPQTPTPAPEPEPLPTPTWLNGKATTPEPAQWDEIADLLDTPFPPVLDLKHLPDTWAAIIKNGQEVGGFLPEISFAAVLGAAMTAIDSRIRIRPHSANPTWTERPILWLMMIANPSAKKSPTMAHFFSGPIGRVKRLKADENKHARREFEDAEFIYKARIRTYRQEKGEAQGSGLDFNRERPTEPEPPKKVRAYTFSDSTMEALGQCLESCPWGITGEFDELSAMFGGMDAYKNGAGRDREDWLKSYSGGPHEISRIKRGNLFVENFAVGVVGATQPDKIAKVLNGETHDGLSQRFIPIAAGHAGQPLNIAPDKQAFGQYMRMLEKLAEITPLDDHHVMLTPHAHAEMDNLRQSIDQLARTVDEQHIASHLDKVVAMAYRTLLIFHCVSNSDTLGQIFENDVSLENAQKVTSLFRSFIVPNILHLRTRVMAKSLVDSWVIKVGQDVLKATDSGKAKITHRDITRNRQGWSDQSDQIRRAVWEVLTAAAWVRPAADMTSRAGYPSTFEINPNLKSELAQRITDDRQRRTDAKKAIWDALNQEGKLQ